MITGKQKIGSTTYLIHNNGYKTYGWHKLDGRDYYFDPNFGGGMITGERKVKNSIYLFGSNGAKIKIISTGQDEINYEVVQNKMYGLVNELRQSHNVNILTKNEQLTKAANQRATEIAKVFSHTRPNGTSVFSIFEEEYYSYKYKYIGENIAMGSYYMNEEKMAEWLFS